MRPSFEEWSREVYGREGVEPLLLTLQDRHGLSVNLLLWCLWGGQYVGEFDPALIRKAADKSDAFARETVIPLRAVRRWLKSTPDGENPSGRNALRARVKEAELMAESLDQEALEALALSGGSEPPLPADADGRARRALAAYVRMTAAAETEGFSVSLLERLIELTLAPSESDGGR